ncbi:MAG: hypothetical protein WD044_17040 [Dongiaceae bacterium]
MSPGSATAGIEFHRRHRKPAVPEAFHDSGARDAQRMESVPVWLLEAGSHSRRSARHSKITI